MISHISPVGSMALLSQLEVNQLQESAATEIHQLFRNCSLAVLNSGSHTDSSKEILEKYKDFKINVLHQERGVKIELQNPPAEAFIDGELIKGIQEHLFSVLRDLLYVDKRIEITTEINEDSSSQITSLVFSILRNASILKAGVEPNIVVCWGGHSINDIEFGYTREVGSQLGLRELNICTGCGPGAMEGPMKGATVGHAKQRVSDGRYIGLTEPGIIAAEPPNPIVNELVILPDIEKRLEAFVRIALDKFIEDTLGDDARRHYQIIIDDAPLVAQTIKKSMQKVTEYRRAIGDAYSFNWSLKIDEPFQYPFIPNHENMANLILTKDQPAQELASNLRRVFSGIVGGNVKDEGIKSIEEFGPFQLKGEKQLMKKVDVLLESFIKQGRMKLPGTVYTPCYKIIT